MRRLSDLETLEQLCEHLEWLVDNGGFAARAIRKFIEGSGEKGNPDFSEADCPQGDTKEVL